MPINYANTAHANGHEALDISEDEAPQGFRYVPQLERRRATIEQSRTQQRSNRYDAWDRAREQFRANPNIGTDIASPKQASHNRDVIYFERPYQSSVVAPS